MADIESVFSEVDVLLYPPIHFVLQLHLLLELVLHLALNNEVWYRPFFVAVRCVEHQNDLLANGGLQLGAILTLLDQLVIAVRVGQVLDFVVAEEVGGYPLHLEVPAQLDVFDVLPIPLFVLRQFCHAGVALKAVRFGHSED